MTNRCSDMNADCEQRKGGRVVREEPIEVTVLACPAEPSMEGVTLHGSSVDVSANGLRLRFPSALPGEAVLDLEIGLLGRNETCHLSGVVCWARKVKDADDYLVGVELQDRPVRGIARWLCACFRGKRDSDDLVRWQESIYEGIRSRDL